jgi:hypothetical protein
MKHVKSLSSLALIAALGVSLSACGGSPSATATSPNVEPLAAQTSSAPAEPAKSPRGNFIKEMGQPAGISDADGKALVNFTINSIAPLAACTGPYPSPVENGHFVVLDVSVETLPELGTTENGSQTFDINSTMFKFVGANGTTFNGNLGTMAAYSCLPDTETIGTNGAGIGPAEKVTGKLVLDLPEPTGTLVYKSYLTSGNGGWEFKF